MSNHSIENATLCSITFRLPGITRKVPSTESKIANRLLSVTRKILDMPELDTVKKQDSATRKRVQDLSIPFQDGVCFVPNEHVSQAHEILTDYEQYKRPELITAFANAYTEAKYEARETLGEYYHEEDYPLVDVLMAKFGMDYYFYSISTAPSLGQINHEVFAQEQARIQSRWDEVVNSSVSILAEELQGLTAHIAERLTPNADGEPKVFRDSMITNLVDFLDRFNPRNISGNESLQIIADQAKALADTLTPAILRGGGKCRLRDMVRGNMETISNQLSSMIVPENNYMTL